MRATDVDRGVHLVRKKHVKESLEMEDEAFDELKLRTMIAPHSVRWPRETVHWQKLHAVPDEARSRVSAAFALMAEIDADPDLSKEGKQRTRQKVAAAALDEFQTSNTLETARKSVERQMQLWAEKVGMTVKRAADVHEATVHAQIRDRLFAMKDRMSFLEQNGADPVIGSALLTAPQFLSGLSDVELKMLRHKMETRVAPEIAAAKVDTARALAEAEEGWDRAQVVIAQRAGLVKNADGIWSQPADTKAA